ncbi:unnamed protein product [Miscanthus lutarioriparius]|uniref:Uncharacterized protein n=1 Tax=Miscanthus lutarioriparius TaxID=422564 RepID=A0A811QEL7_9POAL|nr:unnamed protein product [Miscanthus lutarioriparius]
MASGAEKCSSRSSKVDEWYEQPAATIVDWVTIDGQSVGAWINLVKQLHMEISRRTLAMSSTVGVGVVALLIWVQLWLCCLGCTCRLAVSCTGSRLTCLYADGDNKVRLLGGVNVMLQTASKLLAKPSQPKVVMKQLQDVEY